MKQIIGAFTYNLETKEGTITGNVEPQYALQIFQMLVISETVRMAVQMAAQGTTQVTVPEQEAKDEDGPRWPAKQQVIQKKEAEGEREG